MRRMYSEQELTNVIKAVFEQELEDGALDENVADAVDDYLTEHPVDPTAITGLDIAPKDVTASGNITADSIIENMSGYEVSVNADSSGHITPIYSGIVKNGNKVTIVLFANLNYTGASSVNMFNVKLPSAVVDKLYPYTLGSYTDVLDVKEIPCYSALDTDATISLIIRKATTGLRITGRKLGNLTDSTDYFMRLEVTFLLSNNLTPNE